MNFYILRRGQKLGPFPDGAVEEMSAQGELKAGDLVCYEGDQNWVPVSRFIEHRQQRQTQADEGASAEASEGTEQTEGAPAESVHAGMPTKTTFMRRDDDESDGAGLTEAEQAVIAGGRYVAFEYCWSVVISFKRTRPVLVRAGDDGFGAAFRYSMVSVLLGWWGIPGPIWVLTTVQHNARGGQDVTLETLTRQVGHARAAAACARRRQSTPSGALLRGLGGMMTAFSLALWLGVAWGVWGLTHRNDDEKATGPGAVEFEAANRHLIEAKRAAVFGNGPKALELAAAFNQGVMETYLRMAREHAGTPGYETNRPVIVSFCEWHKDRAVFLVVVPALNQLPATQRNRLGEEAWRISSLALTDLKVGFSDLRVAVGIRSSGKYDQVLTGRYVRDYAANNTGLKSRAEGPRSKSKLHPLFVPMEQLETWKDD